MPQDTRHCGTVAERAAGVRCCICARASAGGWCARHCAACSEAPALDVEAVANMADRERGVEIVAALTQIAEQHRV